MALFKTQELHEPGAVGGLPHKSQVGRAGDGASRGDFPLPYCTALWMVYVVFMDINWQYAYERFYFMEIPDFIHG